MKTYKISEQVVNGLLQYLATKPYSEVFQGIQALQTLQEITEQKDEKDTEVAA